MANVSETNDWPSGVYQYADGDVLDGGANSSETLPIRQLASRALFQRLRNVTPWDPALAAIHGYPLGACVAHGGLTWRSKINDNSYEPAIVSEYWERWGFSTTELMDLLQDVILDLVYADHTLTEEQKSQGLTNLGAATDQILIASETYAPGTSGGNSIAGIQQRVFNTTDHNSIAGASRTGGNLTLPPGKYYIDALAPSGASNRHQAFVRTTTGTVLLHGSSANNNAQVGDDEYALTISHVRGVLTLEVATSIQLMHWTQRAVNNGLGNADSGHGMPAIYAQITVRKLA